MLFTRHTIPNALRAIRRTVRRWFSRQPALVTDEVYNERLRRCFTCARFRSDTGQCHACTCVVRLKCWLAAESCPDPRGPHWNEQTRFSDGL